MDGGANKGQERGITATQLADGGAARLLEIGAKDSGRSGRAQKAAAWRSQSTEAHRHDHPARDARGASAMQSEAESGGERSDPRGEKKIPQGKRDSASKREYNAQSEQTVR